MPPSASSLPIALLCAFVLALACGSAEEENKPGPEGVADAYNELAEHECRCLAETSGFTTQIEDACREQIGDAEEFFPLSCIEDIVARHPEVRPAYDCAAAVTYDYVDCVVGEGCEDRYECADGDTISSEWVCDGFDDCDGGEDEAEDCAPLSCEDGTEIDRSARCDGIEDCAGGEDEPPDCPRSCESRLQSALTECPQPPDELRDEIAACFPT